MAELVIELLLEFLLQVLAQIALELGFGSIAHALGKGREANPTVAAIGIALLGGLVGLIASLVLPERVLPPSRFPGISLVISPLLAGLIMEAFGDWRRQRGGDPTLLATFWGGALFAFTVALVRWIMVGRPD